MSNDTLPKAHIGTVTRIRRMTSWLAKHWPMALWLLALAAVVRGVPEGCHSMDRWMGDGHCYQEFDDDKFVIKRDEWGVDPKVSGNQDVEKAWSMAKRVCAESQGDRGIWTNGR